MLQSSRRDRQGHREALVAAIAADAAARDADGAFPLGAFAVLHDAGLVGRPPLEAEGIGLLLRLLADVGRGDLSVGRIFEGHVNAFWLIRRFGTPAQVRHFGVLADEGALFGVWNTDEPGDPLRLEGGRLQGGKSFCSGVDGLAHAIVTVTQPEGRRMVIVPLEGLPVDRRRWRPLGMRASGSHVVDFSGLAVEPGWMLGAADDYIRQPWFSAGAIRFAAVQAGGARAVFETAVAHLRDAGRVDAPYQAHRVARMGIAVETGYGWLDRAAGAWMAAYEEGAGAGERAIAVANATRSAVEACAMTVLEEAERGVGVAGLLAPHPFERRMRDLRTYLRQPNPDGALAALGAAVASGAWRPGEAHG